MNKYSPEALNATKVTDADLEAAKGVIAERSVFADPKWVGAAAGVLGGLYVTGLTGRSAGKLLGTALGAAAGYYVGSQIDATFEAHNKEDEVNKLIISGSTGLLTGMIGAGVGGVFDSNK